MRRLVPTVALVALIAVPAAPAAGHAVQVGSEPTPGETVSRAPTEVLVRFSEQVESEFAQMQVRDPADERVDAGEPEHAEDRLALRVALLPLTRAGAYAVVYRVVSADGHPIEGTLSFTVPWEALAAAEAEAEATAGATPDAEATAGPTPATASPATASPAPPAPSTGSDGGLGGLAAALIAVVAIGAVGLLVVVRGRSRGGEAA